MQLSSQPSESGTVGCPLWRGRLSQGPLSCSLSIGLSLLYLFLLFWGQALHCYPCALHRSPSPENGHLKHLCTQKQTLQGLALSWGVTLVLSPRVHSGCWDLDRWESCPNGSGEVVRVKWGKLGDLDSMCPRPSLGLSVTCVGQSQRRQELIGNLISQASTGWEELAIFGPFLCGPWRLSIASPRS